MSLLVASQKSLAHPFADLQHPGEIQSERFWKLVLLPTPQGHHQGQTVQGQCSVATGTQEDSMHCSPKRG